MGLLASWWYARRAGVASLDMRLRQIWGEAKPLARLGVVFMAAGLMSTATTYAARVLVARQLGVDSLGFYQAAVTLAGLYVGTIISAMGADFYPRLTAVAREAATWMRLVNEQVQVGLLVAAPGVLATMLFSPLVIRLFYSGQFQAAAPVLRWQVLGVLLQITAWPVGFVLIAKGDGRAFFWAELVASLTNMALVWLGITLFGLVGTGIAFFAFYGLHWAGIFALVRHRYGFHWSPSTLRVWAVVFPTVSAAFLALQFLPSIWATGVAVIATFAMSVYSVKWLDRALGTSVIRLVWGKLLKSLRPGRTATRT